MMKLEKLKRLVKLVRCWNWNARRGCEFGNINEDREFSEVGIIDISTYTDNKADDSIVLNYLLATSPKEMESFITLIESQAKELSTQMNMVQAMAIDLAEIHSALGLDDNEAGGAEPIIAKIEEMQELIVRLGVACGHPMALAVTAGSSAPEELGVEYNPWDPLHDVLDEAIKGMEP